MDIIEQLGGPAVVARIVGCKTPSVSEWRTNGVIPPHRCPAIEVATKGKFTCEQMNPTEPWLRVPDPDWPWHPDGRPVIDIVRSAAAMAQSQKQAA